MAYDAVRPPFTRSTLPVMKLADAMYTIFGDFIGCAGALARRKKTL